MKPTAKQRIERAVERIAHPDDRGIPVVPYTIVVAMILAERARLKRGVRTLIAREQNGLGAARWTRGDYIEACNDILALWEG